MAFDFITEFKKLCKQLQKEDVIVYLEQARKMNDMDQELQDLIGKFNLARFNLNIESNKNEDHNEAEIKRLQEELSDIYDQIMANDSMIAYNDALNDVNRLKQYIEAILTATINGGDPMIVQLPEEGCTGSCSSCSGCH